MFQQKIFANKENRLWVGIFILISVGILIGVLYLIVPSIEFIITPQQQSIYLEIPVKIDLQATEPFLNLNVIPGRILSVDESVLKIEQQGNQIISVAGKTIVYSVNYYQQLVSYNIQKNIPQGWIVIDLEGGWPEAQWQSSESNIRINAVLKFDKQIIQDLPFDVWKEKIANSALIEAKTWLESRSGVEQIKYIFFPDFLTNISNKVPRFTSRIKFSLDI
ncbi:MAG: hypothetical protein WC575_03505 [Patescibacteria group bacterium]